jgi:hypothetical protein
MLFNERGHWTIWELPQALELCQHFGWNVIDSQTNDDKVGNGFTFIIQKI